MNDFHELLKKSTHGFSFLLNADVAVALKLIEQSTLTAALLKGEERFMKARSSESFVVESDADLAEYAYRSLFAVLDSNPEEFVFVKPISGDNQPNNGVLVVTLLESVLNFLVYPEATLRLTNIFGKLRLERTIHSSCIPSVDDDNPEFLLLALQNADKEQVNGFLSALWAEIKSRNALYRGDSGHFFWAGFPDETRSTLSADDLRDRLGVCWCEGKLLVELEFVSLPKSAMESVAVYFRPNAFAAVSSKFRAGGRFIASSKKEWDERTQPKPTNWHGTTFDLSGLDDEPPSIKDGLLEVLCKPRMLADDLAEIRLIGFTSSSREPSDAAEMQFISLLRDRYGLNGL